MVLVVMLWDRQSWCWSRQRTLDEIYVPPCSTTAEDHFSILTHARVRGR
jgi:hypothetical protein